MTDRNSEDKGFEVHDRRRFSSTEGTGAADAGQAGGQGDGPAHGARTGEQCRAAQAAYEEAHAQQRAAGSRNAPLPDIDFSTFILSLATSVLVHLGEMPHPESDAPRQNLPLAKQTIDIIGMLRDKTRGNLTADESQLLDNLLCDLRMKYVAAKRG